MENPVGGKLKEQTVIAVGSPVSEIAACFRRDQPLKVLAEPHQLSSGDSEYLKGAAKDLSWMIPAIAMDGHSLAMMVGLDAYREVIDKACRALVVQRDDR